METCNYLTTNTLDLFHVKEMDNLKSIFPIFVGISAGFPSPAADFIDLDIDLSKELISNPSSTFLGRVKGNSMKDVFIHDKDIIIIDKSLTAKNGNIVVAFIDGEYTVKRIQFDNKNTCWLVAENKNYAPIKVTADNDFLIWGVVTKVIKDVLSSRL